MTLEAWVKPSTLSSMWRTIMIKEKTTNLAYGLYAGNGTSMPSGHVFTSTDNGLAGTKAITLNAWSHVASTWDGTTARLYINGTEVARSALSGTAATSTGALRIGGNNVWAEWFKGVIDEVRVYSRALSAPRSGRIWPRRPPPSRSPAPSRRP